jgi:hypothetical protein
MNHDVDLSTTGGLEGPFEGVKEVFTAAAPHNAWATGEVKAEVTIRQEQYPHVTPTTAQRLNASL